MMMTGLALDKDDQLKQKTEEIIDAFHTTSTNTMRDAKTKDDFVKQWLSMSDNPYSNDDVFEGTTKEGRPKTSKEGGNKKTKQKTLSTSSIEEKVSSTNGKKVYQQSAYKAADGFKRSYSTKNNQDTSNKAANGVKRTYSQKGSTSSTKNST